MTGIAEEAGQLMGALEALIGSVFVSYGLATAHEFVMAIVGDLLADLEEGGLRGDFKSALQELTQRHTKLAPTYAVVSESGPPHDRTFVVEARLNGRRIGVGEGKSKQRAEQRAAADALERSDLWDEPPQ